MDDLNDTQIRANLRSLMTEAGIDPNHTSLMCAGGAVRLRGLLRSIYQLPVRPTQVDELEVSIRRSRGVKRVHVNVDNFERLPTGEWKSLEDEPVVRQRTLRASADAEDDQD